MDEGPAGQKAIFTQSFTIKFKIMKTTNVNIFGIAAIALALGTMSFKASQPLAEVTRWHEISTQGSSPETDIVGAQTPDPTEGGNCNSISQNTRCAVQLT